jgi:RimJ/RimL family protein N-acetyltransferase
MRFFPKLLTQRESAEMIERMQVGIEERGWGFWAVTLKSSGELIGMTGLSPLGVESALPCTPMVEVGWRLSADHWGQGFGPEAATRCLDFAFNELKLSEVYAFTSLLNRPSIRVMQKIGMQDTQRDFDHPRLDQAHRLARHCLYKVTVEQWLEHRHGR